MAITKKDIKQMSSKEGIFSFRHFGVLLLRSGEMSCEIADMAEAGKTDEAVEKLREFEHLLEHIEEWGGK